VPTMIRPLASEDEPFLWEMLYHAVFVPAGDPPPPRDIICEPDIRRYVEGWGRRGDEGFIACGDGGPIGAAWLRLLTGDNRGYGYVDDSTPELAIALLPGYRRRGIGSQLLARLLESARSHCAGISLSVVSESPATRLYRRFGFEVVREDGSGLTMVRRWSKPE